MGNEDIGKLELGLQILEQIEDLGLNRHIQRRYRLVAHNELRLHRQRPGNADPLPLPAAEFVRMPVSQVRPQAHSLQQAEYFIFQRLPFGQPMHLQRFGYNIKYLHARIQ
ncbi:hypothetical protein D3C76_637210 [compost metagenome]